MNVPPSESIAPNIVVAISTFRSDNQAIRLISELYDGDYEFASLVVVCSAGGHGLALTIERKGYTNCHVMPFDMNLGSAGNLYERFKAASDLDGDFMFALNHDAQISPQMFKALKSAAALSSNRIGALYPLRYVPGKRQYDLTGVGHFPFRFRGAHEVSNSDLIDVTWGSSNGALYSLAPFRAGLAPDRSLWMGWEDYLYGLRLRGAGFHQCIVTSASAIDDYEYKTVTVLGRKITISEKPLWYSYYNPRNMTLICLHRFFTPKMLFDWMLWICLFPGHILLSKAGTNRWRGLGLFLVGLLHGLLDRSGKWRLP